jgi:hypothetical protein
MNQQLRNNWCGNLLVVSCGGGGPVMSGLMVLGNLLAGNRRCVDRDDMSAG